MLDVDLPGMNGLEVLEKLRSDERTELLPVILFSATNRHGDVVEGYKLRANSYVAKPTSFSEFSEAMRLLGWYTGLTGTNHRSKTQEAEQLFATSRASGTPRTLPRAYS